MNRKTTQKLLIPLFLMIPAVMRSQDTCHLHLQLWQDTLSPAVFTGVRLQIRNPKGHPASSSFFLQTTESGDLQLPLPLLRSLQPDDSLFLQVGEETYRFPAQWLCNAPQPHLVFLGEKARLLQKVVIWTTRPWAKQEGARRIYSPARQTSAQGGTLYDLLLQIPGVEVTEEGTILYRGRPLRIYINNRPSEAASRDVRFLLIQPTDNIEQVEIISVPTAQYEAEAQNAILNITLRRAHTRKSTLSATARLSYPHEHRMTAQIQMRPGPFQILLSLSPFYEFDLMTIQHFRIFRDTSLSPYPSLYSSLREEQTHLGLAPLLEVSFQPRNPKWSIWWFSYGHLSRHLARGTTRYTLEPATESLLATRIYREDEIHNEVESELGIRWKHPEDTVFLKEFSFSALVSLTREDFVQPILEHPLDSIRWILAGMPADSVSRQMRGMVWQAKADWIFHLFPSWKLLTGILFLANQLQIDLQFFEGWTSSTLSLNDSFLTGTFLYQDLIGGAYVLFSHQTESSPWSLEAGIRVEPWQIQTRTYGVPQVYQAISLFPSFSLGYQASKHHQLYLVVSRRIRRPRAHALNPFVGIGDRSSQWRGNPLLKPEFTYLAEIGWIFQTSHWQITFTPFLRYTENAITRIRWVDPSTQILYITPFNTAYRWQTGIETTVSTSLSPGIRLMLSGEIYTGEQNLTVVDTLQIRQFGTGMNASFQSRPFPSRGARAGVFAQWRIHPQLLLEFNARIFFPSTFGNVRQIHTATLLNPAIRYTFLERRASLTLGGYNVLNQMYFQGITDEETFRAESRFSRWIPRIFLSFSYNWQRRKGVSPHGHEHSGEPAEGM